VNVFQITPTNVYPPSDGGQHRSHGLVTSFPTHGDVVYRYCQGGHLENYFRGDLQQTIQIEDGYRELQHLHPLFDLTRLPELFGLPNVFLGASLRLLKPAVFQRRIDWADVILVELPWQVPAVTSLSDSTPVVYSSHNVEQERFESTSNGFIGDRFTSRVSTIERTALEQAAAVVCTSERDISEYRRRYDVQTNYIVSPNGVGRETVWSEEPRESASRTVRREHDISTDMIGLFVGTDYGPNREAAHELVRIATEAAERGLDMHFLIVGSVGESITTQRDNVTCTGFVSDLDPYFAAADIGLNPIESGSGTNIKLLEYLAKRLPVVTTDFGRRGFQITHEQEALVVPVTAFTDSIARLVSERTLRERLAANGHEYVRETHLWERISTDLRVQLSNVIAEYS